MDQEIKTVQESGWNVRIFEHENFIRISIILYIFQLLYLYSFYDIPLLLFISGIKAVFALIYFDKMMMSLKKVKDAADTDDKFPNLLMATFFFGIGVSVFLIKW